jgi:hypothetical protein
MHILHNIRSPLFRFYFYFYLTSVNKFHVAVFTSWTKQVDSVTEYSRNYVNIIRIHGISTYIDDP